MEPPQPPDDLTPASAPAKPDPNKVELKQDMTCNNNDENARPHEDRIKELVEKCTNLEAKLDLVNHHSNQ